METDTSEQQVLVNLGLTPKQAKVYLTLARSGPSKVNEISKTSKVARPDVYPTIEKLQKLGIVEKLIKKPPSFRAIPIKEGLTRLLENKTQEYEKVKSQAEILRNTIRESSDLGQTDCHQFILIPEGKTVVDRIRTAIETAERTINVVVSWKRFSRGMADLFGESIERACAKRVKLRFVLEEPPANQTAKKLVEGFDRSHCSQIRFIGSHPETVFGIYDEKQVFVITISKTDIQSSPALWSDNRALISLASGYFEALWKSAKGNQKPKRLTSINGVFSTSQEKDFNHPRY